MIISCGTDIIETKRVKDAVKKWDKSFLRRVFTQQEIDYSMKRRFYFEHLAARFAAKEAVLKAFGDGFTGANIKDVEIKNDKNGRPNVILKGDMEKLRKKKKIHTITVSMSHTKDYAQAMAILIGKK
ncbi:MAG: holo-ACP synthase [Candidatus Omnitrophica bacterium]|nr:holo-ACP synthase [Candidatus Omnitrophota bacterium]MBU4478332.1 holo-ACP synthase [Candidatus Omnitrophota bacterium]MCG2704260.1 holo-ACP synthase [Candidatus Omnitrophota bacterium]